MRAGSSALRLVLVFLTLVLVPSLLLAWFTLRAVDAERRARAARLLDGYERYAEFAARTIHHELGREESAWDALLPSAPGGLLAPPAALTTAHARSLWVLAADGRVAAAGDTAGVGLPATPYPDASETVVWDAGVAHADSLEFESGNPAAAAQVWAALASQLESPRLQAIALAVQARTALAAGDAAAALAAARRLRTQYPGLYDLEAEPLDLVARWSEARALAAQHDPEAERAWVALMETAEARRAELTAAQSAFYQGRAAEALNRGAVAGPAAAAAPGGVSDALLVRKLERRLLRARMAGTHASPRVRYLSDVVDGTPFLVAYRLLPGPDNVDGIAGLVVDLAQLSSAVLPRFLAELELSHDARLAIVDDAGRAVIGATPDASAALLTSSLGEPFEFWSVAVSGLAPQAVGALDVRTRAWLAAVAVLLLTITAGAWLVVTGLRRQARLANLKTTFVSNVSHELRTPLASIRMYAEMLEMGDGRLDAGERRRHLAVIRSEAGRLERLIDAVLDFASLRRGTRRFRFEYDEIGPVVAAAAQSFRTQAESQGFAYRVEIEPELPELRVDADAIREVLLNLLSNAVKYSDAERSIVVRAYRTGEAVALEVEDRGIGIDPADQERIFEDFYRVDERLSSTRQGVGLGLTLARRIVEAHGGRIEVHSTRGRGARFTVWLPVEPQPAAPPPGPVAQEAGS